MTHSDLTAVATGLDHTSTNLEVLQYLVSALQKLPQGMEVITRKNKWGETLLHYLRYTKANFEDVLHFLLQRLSLDVNATDDDGRTVFMNCAGEGRSKEALEQIIRAGGDWQRRDKYNSTSLHFAAQGGNVEVVQHLLDMGADVNDENESNEKPLSCVDVRKDSFSSIIQCLVNAGADINGANDYGETLFYRVAGMAGSSTLKTLVELGCDWKVRNKWSETTLHRAVEYGNVEGVQYLLELGADVHARDTLMQETPLLKLGKMEPLPLEKMVKVLIGHGASLEAVDNSGLNVLFRVVYRRASRPQLATLVQLGVPWNSRPPESFGICILHVAAQWGNLEALQYFIELGVPVDTTNSLGETPLFHCVYGDDTKFPEVVTLLLDRGANPLVVEEQGISVLLKAVQSQQISLPNLIWLEQLLIAAGGEGWSHTNHNGEGALYAAVSGRRVEVIKYLISLGFQNNEGTPPILALADGYKRERFEEILDILLESGVDINQRDNQGDNVFMRSISNGVARQELETLALRGAKIGQLNQRGEGVLHLAMTAENVDALKYLLELDRSSVVVGLGTRDAHGLTPLLRCVLHGRGKLEEILDVLKGARREVEVKGYFRKGLLSAAVMYGSVTLSDLKCLVEWGVPWEYCYGDMGDSVLHAAVERGRVDVFEYFVSLGADVLWENDKGEGPLHHLWKTPEAAFGETLDALCAAGADMNARNLEGNTVLHVCTLWGKDPSLLEQLLQREGTLSTARNKRGQNVLHLAAQDSQLDLLKYFLGKGPPFLDIINDRDTDGCTPLLVAAYTRQFQKAADILVAYGADPDAVDNDGHNFSGRCAKISHST